VRLSLDLEQISALQLQLSAASMCAALLAEPKLKLTHAAIVREGDNVLRVTPVKRTPAPSGSPDASMLWFDLQTLKAQLMAVIVCGIPSVERAVINEKEAASGAKKSYKLLVEGTGLTHVMGVSGVKGIASSSNHIIEVEKVLGIESARSTIMSEIQYTMGQHGMDIDTRSRARTHARARAPPAHPPPAAGETRRRRPRDRAASRALTVRGERGRVLPRGTACAGTSCCSPT
jgi:DNA-directed RNA polymerase III subunit RPC1